MVALAAAVFAVAPASAQYPFPEGETPAVTGTFRAGGTVVISGGGFAPGSEVKCEVNGQVVATTTADAEGNFFCEITVPSNLVGRRITVRAVGIATGGAPKIQTLTANVLAATGGDSKALLSIALAVVVAGGLLFTLGKRRAPARS